MNWICCSDLHLSDDPPRCRKDDWWKAMEKVFDQLFFYSKTYAANIIFAGDFFHTPRVSPKLELFVINKFKEFKQCHPRGIFHFIPGQHDLPGHSYERLGDSSLGVVIATLEKNGCNLIDQESIFSIQGFPFGKVDFSAERDILVVHELLWTDEPPFPGAPEKGNVESFVDKLNCKILIAGDNHKGFIKKYQNGKVVINCGSMMRRSIDQIDYQPNMYLLIEAIGGEIEVCSIPLDISQDILESPVETKVKTGDIDMSNFIGLLQNNTKLNLSFKNAVQYVSTQKTYSKEALDLINSKIGEGNVWIK